MNNEQERKLCLELTRADSEEQVIAVRKAVGFWDERRVWRLYGDREHNFNTIGNHHRQHEAPGAIVEPFGPMDSKRSWIG